MINKKINDDNFITLDYERIREEVNNNINVINETKIKHKNRYIKYAFISLSVFFIIMIAVIFIPKFINNSNNYLYYQAASKKQLNYKDLNEESYKQFLIKLDNFSSKLSTTIYENTKDEKQNYVISPVSIYMALAMLAQGTEAQAREEILNALEMTYDDIIKYTNILYAQLNDEDKKGNIIGLEKTMYNKTLKNSIWIDDNITLKEEGLKTLSEKFNCSTYHVPFKTKNKIANNVIKDYISKSTNGLINKDFNLDDETLFTLINTFYLKDTWNYDGDDLLYSKTKYLFNDILDVAFLEGYYISGKQYETENAKHFYTKTSHGLKIKFIIPKEGYSIEDIYTKQLLDEINNINDYLELDYENMIKNYTRCIFPEFEASYDNVINDILMDKLNIISPFIKGNTFTTITNDYAILGEVKHVTKLKVDKKGIEGASIVLQPGAKSPGPDEFTEVYSDFIVDESFIFLVTDTNDVTLFNGIIYNV